MTNGDTGNGMHWQVSAVSVTESETPLACLLGCFLFVSFLQKADNAIV